MAQQSQSSLLSCCPGSVSPSWLSWCNPFHPQSVSGLLGIHLSQSEPQSEVCWSSTSGTGVVPTSP